MFKCTKQEIIEWGTSFSLLKIVIQNKCFLCFIWVLKVSMRLKLFEKGGLCRLRLLLLMIEFSVCSHSGYSTRKLTRRRFFEGVYRRCCNYPLSKLVVNNVLKDLWRRENPDCPEFTCYGRSFAKDPQ